MPRRRVNQSPPARPQTTKPDPLARPAVYELLAHVCAIRVEPPSEEVLAVLARGAALFPRDTKLKRQVAALHAGTYDTAESAPLLESLNAKLPLPAASR